MVFDCFNFIFNMNQVLTIKKKEENLNASCFHCGDSANSQVVKFEDKVFCCHGCKTVYTILQQNNLTNYYQLIDQRQNGLTKPIASKYDFLLNEEVVKDLIQYEDDQQMIIKLKLPQIYCVACVWLIENLYLIENGIISSRVNFLKKEAKIVFAPSVITLKKVVETLASLGYAPSINLESLDKKIIQKDRSLWNQLGIAGFCLGNIMLLSFPEYLGFDPNANPELKNYFKYINLILILPVLFYSSSTYFKSARLALRQKSINIDVPICIGIIALFTRSVFEIVMNIGPGYLDSLAGLIFFLLVGKWFQQKTFDNIAFDKDYKSYFPIACTILKNGIKSQIVLNKVKTGDVVVIKSGELIPGDAVLLSSTAFLDYSFVTGEERAVKRSKGDLIYAGGRNKSSEIQIKINKAISNSYLVELWNHSSFAKKKGTVTSLEFGNRVAKNFTFLVLGIALMTFCYWINYDVNIALNAAVSVLIISCPCAIALSIPFVFGNLLRILGKNGIFVKNINSLETLTKVNSVVFDKTGTITDVSKSSVSYFGEELDDERRILIYSLVRNSSHPMSRIITDFLNIQGVLSKETEYFEEYDGKGIEALVEGKKIRIGSKAFAGSDFSNADSVNATVFVNIDGKQVGFFILESHYKKGLNRILRSFKSFSKISLLSGDNNAEQNNLVELFGGIKNLHFNSSPIDKLNFIKELQEQNQIVAMVGDGLNDAGALAQSDLGIVITSNASSFTPACDIVLSDSNFKSLDKIFEIAKKAKILVYISYFLALVYNIIGLSFAVKGMLSPLIAAVLMPISSITIVLFSLLSSTIVMSKYGFK